MLRLNVFGSSSKGNCYIIENKSKIMLDCGVKNIINFFDFKNLDGILLTHQHRDHIGAIDKVKEIYQNGKYYSHEEVLNKLSLIDIEKVIINDCKSFQINEFLILPFEVSHDVKTYNYLIKDTISNMKILFMTDLSNINDYKFNDVDIFIVEANYNEETVDYLDIKGQRLVNTHSSLQETVKFLENNVNYNTKYIFLCHISSTFEDYFDVELTVKDSLIKNFPHVKVFALNPKLKKPIKYDLQEDYLNKYDFD